MTAERSNYDCHHIGGQGTSFVRAKGYDPWNLPMRNDAEFRKQAYTVSNQDNVHLGKLHGINHLPILHELQTINFPRSFPLDLMHLVYEGLAKLMVSH